MSKEITAKAYMAMCQIYENVLDYANKPVLEDIVYMRGDGSTYIQQKYKRQKAEGRFRAFGANGKVVSLYDSEAKARRYCGEEGYVAEIDPADCRRAGASLEEQFLHCEARMLYWGMEADRLKKEMSGVV